MANNGDIKQEQHLADFLKKIFDHKESGGHKTAQNISSDDKTSLRINTKIVFL